jgi:hypothetical protein
MTRYPLLFTFLDKVSGKGYLANVAVHGSVLAVKEGDDAWWMYGVNPGGLAAPGKTWGEAYIEFRNTLMEVLFDIASEAKDFYEFRAAAKKFFDERNEPTYRDWLAARTEVKAGNIELDGLRHESSESPRRIEINPLEKFHPRDNAVDPQAEVAA